MIGVYLSGTGNTKHCVEKLVSIIDKSADCVPIEDADIIEKIKSESVIFLGYPIQFSNAPYMVRDFIKTNRELWKGKSVFCISTMSVFSGDGAGCTARMLKKYGANILGGLHIKMPDSVCDSKLLKKTKEQNQEIIKLADEKIEKTAAMIFNGTYPKEGISFFARICGLFGQRLWLYGKTVGYSDKLKFNETCVGCGLCSSVCPMGNIKLIDGRPVHMCKCTMCYRCMSMCPNKAITLLGKEVVEQCRYEKYLQ